MKLTNLKEQLAEKSTVTMYIMKKGSEPVLQSDLITLKDEGKVNDRYMVATKKTDGAIMVVVEEEGYTPILTTIEDFHSVVSSHRGKDLHDVTTYTFESDSEFRNLKLA